MFWITSFIILGTTGKSPIFFIVLEIYTVTIYELVYDRFFISIKSLFTLTNSREAVCHILQRKEVQKRNLYCYLWSAFHYAGQIPKLGVMKNSKQYFL